MVTSGSNQFAVRLANGKVLVGGGLPTTSGAWLYDPDTKTWSATGTMNGVRSNATAMLLRNGKVLVAGGGTANNPYAGLRTAELYDPATGVWSLTAAMNDTRNLHTATRSEENTSELQSLRHLVCRLLLEKKQKKHQINISPTPTARLLATATPSRRD